MNNTNTIQNVSKSKQLFYYDRIDQDGTIHIEEKEKKEKNSGQNKKVPPTPRKSFDFFMVLFYLIFLLMVGYCIYFFTYSNSLGITIPIGDSDIIDTTNYENLDEIDLNSVNNTDYSKSESFTIHYFENQSQNNSVKVSQDIENKNSTTLT